MKRYLRFTAAIAILCALASCNENNVITEPFTPVIELDSETGIYAVKKGREFTISPTYQYAESAVYSWSCRGKVIASTPSLVYVFDEADSYYITIRVETSAGSDEEEIRVDVADLAPPVISLAVPSGGVSVLAGREYKFSPDVQNGEQAEYRWTLDGKEAGVEKEYVFLQHEPGVYKLSLNVRNEDGEDSKDITVTVVDSLPVEIVVVAPSFFTQEIVKKVTLGRTLYLRPYVSVSDDAEAFYQWSLDGEAIEGAGSSAYDFTPAAAGDYTLTFTLSYSNMQPGQMTRNIIATGTGEISVDIPVKCYSAETLKARPFSAGCSLSPDKVYEFIPAPGQYVNETVVGGYTGESTHDEATAYAEKRFAANSFVSLGGWGGYIVVGFDHSIENSGGYDFSITGNQFEGSSEPGIVYVMQDTDGNSLPDDEWYELKGSEYGKDETLQYYAVTYYRPGPKMDTRWTDNQGGSDCIDYLAAYHKQDYYYPAWVESDSYILYGVRLKDRTTQDPETGFWHNGSFGWGYADNVGGDMESQENPTATPVKNRFRISDAVNPDGSPANLTHIDFIKVQTGLNVKSGWLGENSTEVFAFTDENNSQ